PLWEEDDRRALLAHLRTWEPGRPTDARGLERQLLAGGLACRVALVGSVLRFAERLAEQAANRARRLATGPLPHREALVAAAAGVVGEGGDEEAQDRQQDAGSDYDSDQHLALPSPRFQRA